MNYKEMIEKARKEGVASEDAMWAGVSRIDKILNTMKTEHPEAYWKFMRKSHEDLYGPHYNKDFANLDVQQISYTDAEGEEHEGAHWTKDDVLTATKNKKFPEHTNEWDKYVAYNAAYADFCKKFPDEDIMDIAYLFFFADDDYEGDGKIFQYMTAMQY